jgi:hypothetical protein
MAKIFLAHSKHDEAIKNLFFRAFAGSGVHPVLKEYETVSPLGSESGQINKNMAVQIEEDILMSSAVFVLLSETVQRLPNTAHWIVFESALAKAKQKPVWLFEPFESHGRINITIPYINHFVRFHMTEGWRRYIQSVSASYDETTALVTSGGSLLGLWAASLPGMLIGGLAGYLLTRKEGRPKGFPFTCDQCFVSYEVHLPGGKGEFRCACCNKYWTIT